MSYNDLIGDVPPIIQEEYGEEETLAWEQDINWEQSCGNSTDTYQRTTSALSVRELII